jgi:hypothetical protein
MELCMIPLGNQSISPTDRQHRRVMKQHEPYPRNGTIPIEILVKNNKF